MSPPPEVETAHRLVHVYREGRVPRVCRQAVTIVRAVWAGRARVRSTAADPTIEGPKLRDLIGELAAEARTSVDINTAG